jgi:hypothetical protein
MALFSFFQSDKVAKKPKPHPQALLTAPCLPGEDEDEKLTESLVKVETKDELKSCFVGDVLYTVRLTLQTIGFLLYLLVGGRSALLRQSHSGRAVGLCLHRRRVLVHSSALLTSCSCSNIVEFVLG